MKKTFIDFFQSNRQVFTPINKTSVGKLYPVITYY